MTEKFFLDKPKNSVLLISLLLHRNNLLLLTRMLPILHHQRLFQQNKQELELLVERRKRYLRVSKKYQLCIVMNKKRGLKAKGLTDEEKQWIRYVLDRADLVYVNLGRKDHVYIGKKDGEQQYCQK